MLTSFPGALWHLLSASKSCSPCRRCRTAEQGPQPCPGAGGGCWRASRPLFPEGRDKCAVLNDFSKPAMALSSPCLLPKISCLALRFCAIFGLAGGLCPLPLCSHQKAAGLIRRAAARSGFTSFVTSILLGNGARSLTVLARSCSAAVVMGWTLPSP